MPYCRMEGIIWAMLAINGAVLVGQVLISVILFRLQRDMSQTIRCAIAQVRKEIEEVSFLDKITEELERKFKSYLENPEFIKNLTSKMNKQWANRLGQATKKMKALGKEMGVDTDSSPTALFLEALNNEEGMIDYAKKNAHKIKMALDTTEPEKAIEEPEGPPDWWSDEDQEIVNKVIAERIEQHGEQESVQMPDM